MIRSLPALLVLSACALSSPAARALTTHCVDTSQELRNALSSTFAGDDVEIRIKSGEYLTAGQRFSVTLYGAQHLEISGGWSGSNDTCTLRMRNAGLSDLDAAGSGQVFHLSVDDAATAPSAYLHNFSISHGNVLNGQAGGMSVFARGQTPELVVDRMRFVSNSNLGGAGTGGGLRIYSQTGGMVVVRNCLMSGNSADVNGGVSISSTHAGAVTHVVNNTIVGNTSTAPSEFSAGGLGVSYTEPHLGVIELRNNAIVLNTAAGVPGDAYATPLSAGFTGINNAYTVAATGKVTSSGTLLGDPGLVSASDPRLAAGSKLIDAGAPLAAADAGSRDLQFRLRVLGAAPDIGAYESDYAIFRGDFED